MLSCVAYAGVIWLIARKGLRATYCNSGPLLVLAIPAAIPIAAAALSLQRFVPNKASDIRYFERTFEMPPSAWASSIYAARDESRDRGIFIHSESPYFLQFSVSSVVFARHRLRRVGFTEVCSPDNELLATYVPEDFPIPWLPLPVSTKLELWCANGGAAWLDSENETVYMAPSVPYNAASTSFISRCAPSTPSHGPSSYSSANFPLYPA